MGRYQTFLILGMFALTVFCCEKCKKYSAKVVYIKSVASVFFILTALTATAVADASNPAYSFCLFVIAGLVFGMLGDVWLDLKLVYTKDDSLHTYFGFFSFLFGHICFIFGLIWNFGQGQFAYIIIPIIAGLLIGVVIGKMDKVMGMDYGKFRWIVTLYGGILVAMTLLSGSLALLNHFQNWTLNMMFIGGILFLASDLILSGTYFGVGKDKSIHIVTNSVLYYWAQFVIASSLLFIK